MKPEGLKTEMGGRELEKRRGVLKKVEKKETREKMGVAVESVKRVRRCSAKEDGWPARGSMQGARHRRLQSAGGVLATGEKKGVGKFDGAASNL